MAKNPKWGKEEEILLLNLYLKIRGDRYTEDHPDIIFLSQLLNKRAHALGIKINANYRNKTGIFMKLKNIQSIDPNSETDLPNYSSMDEYVWAEYSSDKNSLENICQEITNKYK